MSDEELRAWQQDVDSFGGRIGPSDAELLWKELQASRLGGSHTFNTKSLNPTFPKSVTLAEIKLSRPICVDVTCSYLNELYLPFPTPQGGPVVVPPVANEGAEPGDGFARITWGVPGAPQMSVDCDVAMGWRHPFTASYLRVEYIPVDEGSTFETHLKSGQVRDLGVRAMISPASGAPCKPLVKSMFYPSIATGQVRWATIPRWARSFRLSNFSPSPGAANLDIFVFSQNSFAGAQANFRSDGVAGEWPYWVIRNHAMPLTPMSKFISVGNPLGAVSIENAILLCELAV